MHKYKLLQRHRINRVMFEAGALVDDIPDQLGDWWITQGVAERVGGPAIATSIQTSAPKVAPSVARAAPTIAAPKLAPRFKCCGWK